MSLTRVQIPNMLLAAIFMGSGFSALFAQSQVGAALLPWDHPDWFRTMVGLIQATAGGSLLIARAVPVASSLLGVVMLGAIVTHLRSGAAPYAAIPLLLLAGLAYVAVTAWRNRNRP